MPEHDLVRLLDMREGLQVVELQIEGNSPAAGRRVAGLQLPEGVRLVSVMRGGEAEIAVGETVLRPGDQVSRSSSPAARTLCDARSCAPRPRGARHTRQ